MPALALPLLRRAYPLWVHLAMFALAILLPLWLALGGTAWLYVAHVRQRYELETLLLTHRLGADFERRLARLADTARALATSPAIDAGNFERFHAQTVAMTPEGGGIGLRDRTSQMLVNSLVPYGTPLPRSSAEEVRRADQCALETRAVCFTNLYRGTTDPQPYIMASVPVIRDGEARYVLGFGLRASHLARLLGDGAVPEGWIAVVVGNDDRVIARSSSHDTYVGKHATGVFRAATQGDEGTFRAISFDGEPMQLAYWRLPTSQWRIAVGVPQSVLNTPLHQSLVWIAVVGSLTLGLSVALAILCGRRLARPVVGLSRHAAQIGRAAAPPAPAAPSSIAEVNAVAAALADADERLRQSFAERDAAQASLRQANEDLEARVDEAIHATEEAQARAAHAQRMQALGQLAGGIAHDFNNVLQVTTGCAAIIGRRAQDPEAARHFARLILGASERGSAITRRLLAFAKQNDLRAEPVEVAALLAGMQELLAHTLGANVAVVVDVAPDLPAAFADKGQLETVLVNLATNARDAMPGGGQIAMAAVQHDVAAGEANGHGLEPGRYIRITVSDTGEGMAPDVLARATEPFFTTKDRLEGTGLGLAMARGFAEQSGGRLRIESRPGHGTSVTLWLRVAAEATAPTPPPAPLPDRHGRARVLLVDDEALVREVLASELTEAGYQVTQAAGGAAALSVFDDFQLPDAVVTDLAMPGMNGLDLIRAIRKRGLDLPAILLTGHAEEGMPLALEGAVTRNFSLVRKPVSGPDLAARLAALLAAAAGAPRAAWPGPPPSPRRESLRPDIAAPDSKRAGAACATPAPNSAETRDQRE